MDPNSKANGAIHGIAQVANSYGALPKKAGAERGNPPTGTDRNDAADNAESAVSNPPVLRQDEKKSSVLTLPADFAHNDDSETQQRQLPAPPPGCWPWKATADSPPASLYKAGNNKSPKIKGKAAPSSSAPLIPPLHPASLFTLIPDAAPPASPEAQALHNYLWNAPADMLCKSIFREQVGSPAKTGSSTKAGPPGNFPHEWISAVQDSMSEVVEKMVTVVLSAASEQAWSKLIPHIEGQEGFDWKPFEKLCNAAYNTLISADSSMKLLPRTTLILLGEMLDELQQAPGYQGLEHAQRIKVNSDAFFGAALFLGLMGPLQHQLKVRGNNYNYSRLGTMLACYLKACFSIASTSQGAIAGTIVGFARPDQLAQCAEFSRKLLLEARRIAKLRTVCFEHEFNDPELDQLLDNNITVYFTNSWLTRTDDYDHQLASGRYLLVKPDGRHYACHSYRKFANYVGQGSKGTLAETILHVAGERLKNFLCHTYLYGPVRPLFSDIHGRSVEPIPELQTRFLVRKEASGNITVEYSCTDIKVGRVMLIGNTEEDEFEAMPALSASLEFAGFWYFFPNEEFEAGRTRITGRNLHLFE